MHLRLLIASSVVCVLQSSAWALTYEVDFRLFLKGDPLRHPEFERHINGTIATDGTLGQILDGQIVDWDIWSRDLFPHTPDLNFSPDNSVLRVSDTSDSVLTATTESLVFFPSSTDQPTDELVITHRIGVDYRGRPLGSQLWFQSSTTEFPGRANMICNDDPLGCTVYQDAPAQGVGEPFVLGTRQQVPEPRTCIWLWLGVALVLLRPRRYTEVS